MAQNWWTRPLACETWQGPSELQERAARRAQYYLCNYQHLTGDCIGKSLGNSIPVIGQLTTVLPGSWESLICVKADLDIACLSALTRSQREAVFTCWVEDADEGDAAHEFGVSRQAVCRRLGRARARLGKYLAEGVASEGG